MAISSEFPQAVLPNSGQPAQTNPAANDDPATRVFDNMISQSIKFKIPIIDVEVELGSPRDRLHTSVNELDQKVNAAEQLLSDHSQPIKTLMSKWHFQTDNFGVNDSTYNAVLRSFYRARDSYNKTLHAADNPESSTQLQNIKADRDLLSDVLKVLETAREAKYITSAEYEQLGKDNSYPSENTLWEYNIQKFNTMAETLQTRMNTLKEALSQ